MLDGRRGVAERLVGSRQVRGIAWRIAQAHGLDLPFHGRLVRKGTQCDDEGAHGAVGDGDLVFRRELVDDRLGRPAHDLVALATLRGLQHEHDRDRRLLHILRQLDLHRQGGFQRRAGVPAGPVAFRAADHDQAGAEVADGRLQERHRVTAQARGRDVHQHHRLVGGEVCSRARQPLRRCRRRADAGRMQRGLQAGRLAEGVLHKQHARRPHHLDQSLTEVVLRVGVEHGVHHHAHRVKPRFGRGDGLLEDRLPNWKVELDGVDERAVEVPANRRMRGGVGHDQCLAIGLLALGQSSRGIQPVDIGLGPDGDRERDGVDAYPLGPQ